MLARLTLNRRVRMGFNLTCAVIVLLGAGVLLSSSINVSAADGLWITRVTPLGGASSPFDRLEIQFSGAVQSGTFTLEDVLLTGPGGVITPAALNYLADDRYELVSSGTGLSTYALVIGPDVRDLSNLPMDQNHNGTPGEPGDAYTGALFSAGVIITDTQTTYEGQNLIIYGNTATINGAHTFAGVAVLGGATLTHSPTTADTEYRLELTITDTLWITAGAKIDVTSRGYLPGYTWGNTTVGGATGESGGSYGGLGYSHSGSTNRVYGDYRNPNEPGSGGGAAGGVAGGGLVRITAHAAVIEGAILANGAAGVYPQNSGGSGGGIWLSVDTLSGSGTIAANGGVGSHIGYGGGDGGGGRVAVYYGTLDGFDPTRQVTAHGATYDGSAVGTVYIKQNGGEGQLRIDSHGTTTGVWTPLGQSSDTVFVVDHLIISGTNVIAAPEHDMPIQANNVSILGNGMLTHQPATITDTYALRLTVADTLLIGTTGRIDVSGRGYLPGRTLGNTIIGGASGWAGGSYGGLGNGATNFTYGDYRHPNEPGSGGGAEQGKPGGGLVRITAHAAVIEGAILANGATGVYPLNGGGSGGGILLNAGTLSGNGTVAANGGNGGSIGYGGGSGGGGRVAVYYWDSMTLPPANVTANGGTGGAGPGQPGSVYISHHPYFSWSRPVESLFHDTERLEWAALGINPVSVTVNIAAFNAGQPYPLGAGLAPLGDSLFWDTTSVPDGCYELRATFYNLSGQVIGQATRTVLVNNSVAWHGGRLTAAETWMVDRVHVVESPLSLATGVTLTIQAGAVVKFAPGASIVVEAGAVLNAPATADAPIILTSLSDDSAGGDTNLDASQTLPTPGDWNGLGVQGTGQVNLSPYVVLRYIRLVHSGTLVGSEIWLGTFVHEITGNVTVPAGATLTIQPGAIVKFGNKLGLTVQAGAQLIARGNVAQPVVFTSIRDDAFGGDTNRDGNSTTPAAGDWRWIYIDGQATFDHAIIAYGGGTASGSWDDTGVIRTNGSAVLRVSNSLIREVFYDGILMFGGTATVSNTVLTGIDRGVNIWSGATMEVVNCTSDNNGTGLLAHGGGLTVINTIASNNLNFGINNCCGSLPVVRHSNVWSLSGVNYGGMADQTGQNGNISVDPQFKDAAGGNYRLRYVSPMIDAADGAAAPPTDMMGAPRYDDPRTSNTGIAAPGGAFADMGAYEFVETAQSNLDLVVDSVIGPLQVTATQQVQVMWTVRNMGTQTVADTWRDAVALLGPDGTVLEAGEFVSSATLGPNQTATFSATVRVPGGTEGDYRWQVRANSRGDVFEGQNWDNNTGQSAGVASLSVPELRVGQTLAGGFTEQGETFLYKIQPALGQDVLILLDRDGSSGWTQLYIGRGQAPTPQQFYARSAQWNQPDASIIINNADGGLYYVLVVAQALPGGPAAWQLTASEAVFSLDSLDLARGSNLGRVTVGLNGVGFRPGMQVHLVQGGVTRAAERISLMDSTLAYATFDMQGLATGLYDVRVTVQTNSQTLAGAFEVITGQAGYLKTTIWLPDAIRAGRQFVAWIDYANLGDTDIDSPLIFVESKTGNAMRLSPSEPFTTTDLLIQAIAPDGPAGVLRPGQAWRAPVLVMGRLGDNSLTTYIADTTFAETMDWERLRDKIRPPTASPEWDVVWNGMVQEAGPTIGGYVRLLAQGATLRGVRAGQRGWAPFDALQFLIQDRLIDLRATLVGNAYVRDTLHPAGYVMCSALNTATDGISATVRSTADGLVRFQSLPGGAYLPAFEGYLPPLDLQPSVVPQGGKLTGQTWILREGGRLAGRIVAPAGTVFDSQTMAVAAASSDGQQYVGEINADGTYVIAGVPAGVYKVTFSGVDLVSTAVYSVTAYEGRTTAVGDLVTQLGGIITGTVRSAGDGQPLADALVMIVDSNGNPRGAKTDASGAYELRGVTPGIRSVAAGLGLPAQQVIIGVRVLAGQTTGNVNFELEPTARLEGTVSAGGAPVSQAVVYLLNGDRWVALATTDADGHYRMAHIAPGDYTIQVDHWQHAIFTATRTLAGGLNTYDVALSPTSWIKGVVRQTGNHAPLPGVLVLLVGPDDERKIQQMQTDQDGIFGFSRLSAGQYVLTLSDGSHRQTLQVISPSTTTINTTIDLTVGAITGRLVGPDGQPFEGSLVSLVYDNQSLLTVAPDASGVYSIPFVSPGTYDLVFQAHHAFFPTRHGINVTANSVTHVADVGASTPSTLTVTFYDLTSGQPLTTGMTVLWRTDVPDSLQTPIALSLNPTPTVSFTRLTPGQYRLKNYIYRHESVVRELTIVAGHQSLDIYVGEPARMVGWVTDLNGVALENMDITIYQPTAPALRWHASSDALGYYVLPYLPPGAYTAVIADTRVLTTGARYAPLTVTGLTVNAGDVVTQSFRLAAANASVSGQVGGGADIPVGAQVTAYTPDGIPVATTLANADGMYALAALGPGVYQVRVRTQNYWVMPITVTLGAGQVLTGANLAASWQVDPPWFWIDLNGFDFSNSALFNNSVSWAIGDWLARKLGEPQDPTAVYPPPPNLDKCPLAAAWWNEAEYWRRIKDERLQNWRDFWLAHQQVLWADVGFFGAKLLKLAVDLYTTRGIDFEKAKLTQLQQQNNALFENYINTASDKDLDAWWQVSDNVIKQTEHVRNLEVINALGRGGISGATIDTSLLPNLDRLFGKILNSNTYASRDNVIDLIRSVNSMGETIGGLLNSSVNVYNLAAKNLGGKQMPWLKQMGVIIDTLGVLNASLQGVMDYTRNILQYWALEDEFNEAARNYIHAAMQAQYAARYCDDDIYTRNAEKPPKRPPRKDDEKTRPDKRSGDPNDKATIGVGAPGYVPAGTRLVYTIRFENVPTATAPAQQVVITDVLHPNLDWSTFELLEIGFNNTTVAVPSARQFFDGQVSVAGDPNPVRVTASINAQTGVVRWDMRSVDPVTGDWPEDPLAGFLPPNDDTHRGEGYVMFAIRPKLDLAYGAVITNQARIVFDVNEPIDTNIVTNTIGVRHWIYLPVVIRNR